MILVACASFAIALSYPIQYWMATESNENTMAKLAALRDASREAAETPNVTGAGEAMSSAAPSCVVSEETPKSETVALEVPNIESTPRVEETYVTATRVSEAMPSPATSESAKESRVEVSSEPVTNRPIVYTTAASEATRAPAEPSENMDATMSVPESTPEASQTTAEAPIASEEFQREPEETLSSQMPAAEQEEAGPISETPFATEIPRIAPPETIAPSATASPAPSPTPRITVQPTPTPNRRVRSGALPYPEKERIELDEALILPEYRELYALNEDIVGWITIPNMKINYPVVQSEDNDFYLDHDFFGETNNNGQIILDELCDPYTPSYNLVVSGHSMKNGSMFGELPYYKDKGFWRRNPIVYFDTLMERREYVIFAAFFSADYDVDETGFRYNADIQYRLDAEQWLAEIEANQLYDTKIDAEFGDEFLTLTTCSKAHHEDGRFVVVCRRVREGETF